MMQGYSTKVLAEVKTSGATIQLLDHHWDAGAEILDDEPNVIVRLRMYPFRLKVVGWIDQGQSSEFGRLMLHPGTVATHARAADESEDARMLVCRFDRDWLSDFIESSSPWSSSDVKPKLNCRNSYIDQTMHRLAAELSEPNLASNRLIESLSTSLAVDIARDLGVQCADSSSNGGTLSKRRLKLIQDYIYSFSDGSPNLADVAKECGLSIAHLRRLFKNTTGRTLHDFIDEVRISRACALLTETSLPIKVISYRLGFCHPSALSSTFKNAMGDSPSDYRDRFANV